MEPTVGKYFGVGGQLSEIPGVFFGIECEIEAVTKAKNFGAFQCKEDLSLRNHGWEFVSEPMPLKETVKAFTELHAWLGLDPDKNPFSHRTSTHVHVNVSNLPLDQARNFLLLYALYEEFYFSMVKPERRANIHCVPLTETHLPTLYKNNIHWIRDHWSKYTAMNVLRVTDLGTFEFRHHHGTGDAEELRIWLEVLENTYTLAKTAQINEDNLTNPEVLKDWFIKIFCPSPKTMMMLPTMMNIISNSLIDVKFSTLKA